MSKNTLLSELINYVSANSSGNVTIAAPSSGYALDVSGTGRFTGNLNVIFANTGGSIDNNAYLRLVNTGAATLNQSIDLVMRWQDGTYNGTGGISMVRESATARSGKLILQPIDSSGNNVSALTLASSGAATFSSSVTSSDAFISTDGTNTIRLQKAYFGGIDAIYQTGTNAFGIYLGGGVYTAAKLYITNGGNVGIGTTTVGTKLDVLGDVRIQGGGSVSYAVLNMLDNTSGGSNWAIFSGYPALGNFTIRESGVANHLVIAKTTGAATFSSSVTAGTSILWGGTPNNNLSAGSMSMVDTATGTRYLQLSVTNTIANIATNYSSSNIPLSLNSYGNANQLYLATDGKVGIGTASPSRKLSVVGSSVPLQVNSDNNSYLLELIYSGGSSSGFIGSLNNGLIFAPSSGTEAMRITSGGDIDVSGGAVRANGGYFRLATSGGVTASGYFIRKASWIGTGTDHTPSIAAEGGYGINFYTNGTASERLTITSGGNVSAANLLYADRFSLSGYPTLYGVKVVKGDAVSSLAINLASIFSEMSSNFSGGNVVGVFGKYTIFRSGQVETGIFSISRSSGGTWSSGAYTVQTATGAYSLSSVSGSSNTVTLNFNTSVYVMVEVTAMIE